MRVPLWGELSFKGAAKRKVPLRRRAPAGGMRRPAGERAVGRLEARWGDLAAARDAGEQARARGQG